LEQILNFLKLVGNWHIIRDLVFLLINVLFQQLIHILEPGALSPAFLWSVAPATDLYVPKIGRMFAESIAKALLEAEKNLEPALMDIGMGNLTGVTHNRRNSPWVNYGTIDPHLGVIRVDKADGTPLATVWNYAIHGICYDAPNMKFCSDVMGSVCDWIESNIGGVALFMNGDAGDVNPIFSVCCNNGPNFSGGPVIGKAVQTVRDGLNPTNVVSMMSHSQKVPFGPTNLNLTLDRLDNCTRGGPLDIYRICVILDCDANIHLPSSWLPENPVFNAVKFTIHGVNSVIVSIPGEALVELGWQIRNDTQDLHFTNTFLQGYTNDHLGYFATANEYEWGDYEGLLTFWGIGTADRIRKACYTVAKAVAP